MARQRLVDPMTTVEAVSRRALGVATQAEVDATAGELQRYRDTDEARREAPVVTGSTADGTALASLIAALTKRGLIVDGTETVKDEVVTNTVTADIVNATDLNATRTQVTGDFTLTSIEDTGSGDSIGYLAVKNWDSTTTMLVTPEGSYISLKTINDRALQLFNGAQLATFAFDGTSPEAATFRVDGVNGNTTVAGTLAVTGAVTIAGGLNTPYILHDMQDAADTATNTSTTAYADARNWSVTLPTGTWTVWLTASVALKHSVANGDIQARTRIAGTNQGSVTLTRAYPTSYVTTTMTGSRTGQSGTIALTVEYRPVTAGTASATNPAILMIAKRTA